MRIPRPVRILFLLLLLPTLLLGLWIGHISADGTKHSSAPTFLLTAAEETPFSHFGRQWYAVDNTLADALAESGLPRADTRVWENCAIRRGERIHSKLRLVCPDGYMVSLSN
jgi:hypothetical protein